MTLFELLAVDQPTGHSRQIKERWYKDTPQGRFVAHSLTAFFCRRATEIGLTPQQWLGGELTTQDLWVQVFDRQAVENDLKPLIPDANTWWDLANPGSNAVGRDWWEWFKGGRGPIRGWLYHLVRTSTDHGKSYHNSLRGWEKRSGVNGCWVPLAYAPIYHGYDPVSQVNEDLAHNERRPITHAEAEAVYQAGCGRCHYDDVPIGGVGVPWQVDHFVKRSEFQKMRAWLDIPANYVPACIPCHDEKTRDDLTGNQMKGRIHARRDLQRLRGRS